MHYLYPGSLADIFTYISLSGRPSGATSSRQALPSPSSFLLLRAAMLAKVHENYKLLWWGLGIFQCCFFSRCHQSEQKLWNSCFYTPCDVTGSGNLEGFWLAQRLHTIPPSNCCHGYISARSSQLLSWLWTVNVVGSKWLFIVSSALVDGLIHWLTFHLFPYITWPVITGQHTSIITGAKTHVSVSLADLCLHNVWSTRVTCHLADLCLHNVLPACVYTRSGCWPIFSILTYAE